MGSAKLLTVAGAATFISITAASAADLRLPPPPPIPEFSGWYLRGDIGMSNQQFKELSHPTFATAPGFEFLDKGGFDSAPIYGIGAGYAWNSWLRFDVRGEYRGGAGFSGAELGGRSGKASPPGCPLRANGHHGGAGLDGDDGLRAGAVEVGRID